MNMSVPFYLDWINTYNDAIYTDLNNGNIDIPKDPDDSEATEEKQKCESEIDEAVTHCKAVYAGAGWVTLASCPVLAGVPMLGGYLVAACGSMSSYVNVRATAWCEDQGKVAKIQKCN